MLYGTTSHTNRPTVGLHARQKRGVTEQEAEEEEILDWFLAIDETFMEIKALRHRAGLVMILADLLCVVVMHLLDV